MKIFISYFDILLDFFHWDRQYLESIRHDKDFNFVMLEQGL